MTDSPIACTLSGAQMAARRTDVMALSERALRERTSIDGGALLRFDADPDIQRALVELVAAEAECCPFLTLTLQRAGDALELRITGPDDAQPIIAEMFR
jgi:hypothetical protein